MSRALLEYNNGDKRIILKTGSLYYLDSMTRTFKDEKEFLGSKLVKNKLGNVDGGCVKLFNVRNISSKEELPIIYNQEELLLEDDVYGNEISVIENTRKLLFNSKNKLFLKKFMEIPIFKATTNFMVKISYNELILLNKYNIKTETVNGEYFVKASDILNSIINLKKIGALRNIFEEVLSNWKNRLVVNSMDSIYYYSRNFNILINEYSDKLSQKNEIKNLKINAENILKLFSYHEEKSAIMVKIKRHKNF